jgi:CRISPR-associated protein Csd1
MILQALSGYYDRLSARADGSISPPGYSYQSISFAVLLSADGAVVDIQDLRQVEDKKVRPISLLVPQPPKRSGRNPPPAFMSDKAGYVFGVQRDKEDKTKTVENTEYQAAFRAYHEQLLGGVDDDGCRALLQFLAQWVPAQFPGLRHADDLVDGNIVFRLDGVRGYLHDRPAIRTVWDTQNATTLAKSAMCLISGELRPVARLHHSIKGVRGAQSSGASIVSFNQDSFASFGKDQGDNAPVSEQATFAYTTALNALLSKDSRQKLQIGDASTVYWAEADSTDAAVSAEVAAQMLFAPTEFDTAAADASETDKLRRQIMDHIAKGRPLDKPELHLDPGTRFYILGLAPNAARLSVRFWEMTTLGALGEAFYQHWRDLRIETRFSPGQQPALAALALQTAPARKGANDEFKLSFDDVSPLLAGELTRAVLSGGRYPGSLLSTLVMRIRTDGYLGRLRVPLIKATLVRAMRLENRLPQEDYLVRSDPNDPNVARRLGRLFAVLERAQLTALGGDINTTIKDKFLGAAAATPGQVFVGLLKNAQHHTKRLRNGHSDAKWIKDSSHARRAGFGIERDIGAICGTLTDGFPQQHSIEDQGLFLIGYYQERFGGKADPAIGPEAGIDIPDDTSSETTDEQE